MVHDVVWLTILIIYVVTHGYSRLERNICRAWLHGLYSWMSTDHGISIMYWLDTCRICPHRLHEQMPPHVLVWQGFKALMFYMCILITDNIQYIKYEDNLVWARTGVHYLLAVQSPLMYFSVLELFGWLLRSAGNLLGVSTLIKLAGTNFFCGLFKIIQNLEYLQFSTIKNKVFN